MDYTSQIAQLLQRKFAQADLLQGYDRASLDTLLINLKNLIEEKVMGNNSIIIECMSDCAKAQTDSRKREIFEAMAEVWANNDRNILSTICDRFAPRFGRRFVLDAMHEEWFNYHDNWMREYNKPLLENYSKYLSDNPKSINTPIIEYAIREMQDGRMLPDAKYLSKKFPNSNEAAIAEVLNEAANYKDQISLIAEDIL